MKEKVEKYEFIYDVPPEDKLKSNQFFNIINPDVSINVSLTCRRHAMRVWSIG